MKLFLLNTMENKKSRKIGLKILGFSTIFYGFSKLFWKKRKRLNSIRLVSAQAAQSRGESARARAREGDFAQRSSGFG
jgi:hypothetical protein